MGLGGAKRRRRGSGQGKGFGPGGWALGLAGVVGIGWGGLALFRGEREPAPLSIASAGMAAAVAPAGEPGAPGPMTVGSGRGGPVPPGLVEAFGRVGSDDVQALVDLRRLAVEFPGSPEAARAEAALGGERERCQREAAAAEGAPAQALRLLTRAYLASLSGAERRAMRPQLDALSEQVFFSRGGEAPGTTEYTVQPGDSLSRIAKQQSTDYRLVRRMSGLKSDNIRVNQRLRIPAASVDVIAFKRDFDLTILFGGYYLRSFDIATGKNDKTPEGTFEIGTKMVNPDWYSPEGKVYKYGSEENVLGTRWLAFIDTPDYQGFGIHGTKFPESIGTEASMGCIRLRNEEVEVLFDLVPSGARVRITR